MCQLFGVSVALLLLVVIKSGSALNCWNCNSEFDVTCRDYFNVTKILDIRRHFENFNYQNHRTVQDSPRNDPYLQHCDESYSNRYNEKAVCIKRVYRGMGSHNDIPHVQRDCRIVPKDFRVGDCPEELKNDKSKITDHCSTCDFEGCNSAKGITLNNILATASILIIFFMLK